MFVKRIGNIASRLVKVGYQERQKLHARTISSRSTCTIARQDIISMVQGAEIKMGFPGPICNSELFQNWKSELFQKYQIIPEELYPEDSFSEDVKRDLCTGDVVLLKEGKNEEESIFAVKIFHDYYDEYSKHIFWFEVLWTRASRPTKYVPFSTWDIKGRDLYPLAKLRQAWGKKDERSKVLDEKHERGDAARKAMQGMRVSNELKEMMEQLDRGIELDKVEEKVNELHHLPSPPSPPSSFYQLYNVYCDHCCSLQNVTVPVASLSKPIKVRCGHCKRIFVLEISPTFELPPSYKNHFDQSKFLTRGSTRNILNGKVSKGGNSKFEFTQQNFSLTGVSNKDKK